MIRSAINASLIAVIALVLGLSFTQSLAEKPAAEQPAAKEKEAQKEKAEKVKVPRVYGDYAKIELTDEQKIKIAEIHADILAKRKALEQEEEARSQAVLTDAQKAEIAKIREEEVAKKKEKLAKDKAEKDAAKAKQTEADKAKTE